MKKFMFCACAALLVFMGSSCRQLDSFGFVNQDLDRQLEVANPLNDEKKTPKKSVNELTVLLKSFAATPETFVVSNQKGDVFTTLRGTKINTAKAVFVDAKGEVVKGVISLTINELHTPMDMLLADKPTNVARKNGYLESYGEFKITATHEGQPVQLRAGSSLTVETEAADNGKRTPPRMPLWDADTSDLMEETKGLNHLAERTSVRQFFKLQRGAIWKELPEKAETNAFNRLQFELTQLNKWRNCDIFREDTTQKTTVMCHIAQNLAPSVFDGQTTTQAAVVYFKPLGINGLIKFYQPILNAPTHKSGFYSEEMSLPIGIEGTLVAVSFKEGKLFCATKNVRINAPINNEKATFFTLLPTEINRVDFLTLMRNL
jgi:hypothetical protein